MYVTSELPVDVEHGAAEQHFLNDAICACAGYAALIAAGLPENKAEWGCEADFERAGPFLEQAKVAAIELLSKDENFRAAENLALALLDRRRLNSDLISLILLLPDGEISESQFDEAIAYMSLAS